MNLLNKGITTALVVTLSLMAAACSSVVDHKSGKDVSYALDFDNHNKEKASIYVIRHKNDPTHSYRKLYLDGKFVTNIGGCGWFFREVEPGKHTITAESRWGNYTQMTLDAKPGEEYYLLHGYSSRNFQMLYIPTAMNLKTASITGGRNTINLCPNDLLEDLDGTQPDLPANASIEEIAVDEEILYRR